MMQTPIILVVFQIIFIHMKKKKTVIKAGHWEFLPPLPIFILHLARDMHLFHCLLTGAAEVKQARHFQPEWEINLL